MLFASYADIVIPKAQRTNPSFLTTSMQYPAQALGLLMIEVLMDLDGQDTSRESSSSQRPSTKTEKHRSPTTHTLKNINDSFDASNGTSSIWGKLH